LRRANAAILQLSLQYLRRGFLVLKGVPHRSQATLLGFGHDRAFRSLSAASPLGRG